MTQTQSIPTRITTQSQSDDDGERHSEDSESGRHPESEES